MRAVSFLSTVAGLASWLAQESTAAHLRSTSVRKTPDASLKVAAPRGLATETDYVMACKDNLLGLDVISDGIISQVDFANFLKDYCIVEGKCEEDVEMSFTSLSAELQLAFVEFVCDEQDDCLEDILTQGAEFGLSINQATESEVEIAVVELCEATYELAVQADLVEEPAPEPTNPPTTGGDDGLSGGAIAGIVIAVLAVAIGGGYFAWIYRSKQSADSDKLPKGKVVPPPSKGDDKSGGGSAVMKWDDVKKAHEGGSTKKEKETTLGGFFSGFGRNKQESKAAPKVQKDQVQEGPEGDGSIMTEDSKIMKILPVEFLSFPTPKSSVAQDNAREILKDDASDATPSSVQFFQAQHQPVSSDKVITPYETAGAIALTRNKSDDESVEVSIKSNDLSLMENAINKGNWNDVARLALERVESNDSDEVSALASRAESTFIHTSADSQQYFLKSSKSFHSARSSLSAKDQARAATMLQLLERGDFAALASFASAFTSDNPLGTVDSLPEESLAEESEADTSSFPDSVPGTRTDSLGETPAALMAASGSASVHTTSTKSNSPPSFKSAELADDDEDKAGATLAAAAASRSFDSSTGKKRSLLGLFRRGSRKSESTSEVAQNAIADDESDIGSKSYMSSLHTIDSLRAELDKAVARGDWAAVEVISAQIVSDNNGPGGGFSIASSNEGDDQTVSTFQTDVKSPLDDSGLGPEHNMDVSGDSIDMAPGASLDSEDNDIIGLLNRSGTPKKEQDLETADDLRARLDKAAETGDWGEVEKLSSQILSPVESPPSNTQVLEVKDSLSPGDKIQIAPTGKIQKSAEVEVAERVASPMPEEKPTFAAPVLAPLSPHLVSPTDSADKNGATPGLGVYFMSNEHSLNSDTEGRSIPESPTPSSTSASVVEQETLQEFERLVNAKDWAGLAAFARGDSEDEESTERRMLAMTSLGPLSTSADKPDKEMEPPVLTKSPEEYVEMLSESKGHPVVKEKKEAKTKDLSTSARKESKKKVKSERKKEKKPKIQLDLTALEEDKEFAVVSPSPSKTSSKHKSRRKQDIPVEIDCSSNAKSRVSRKSHRSHKSATTETSDFIDI